LRKFWIPVVLILLATPALAGDSILRFTYNYGSSETIGSPSIVFVPPSAGPSEPPTICDEKPRPHDCPKAPTGFSVEDPEEVKRDSLGVGFSHFLNEDLSLEFSASVPYGNPRTDTLSLSAGVAYYLGTRAYIPLALGYNGQLDSFALVAGFGVELPAGERTSFRLVATEELLTANHLESDLAWSLGASVGFQLGETK
jgi:hypothetical protein